VWNVADSKLWYVTPEQAQGFLDLSKTEGYKKSIIEKEVSLIQGNMGEIMRTFSKEACNIIDLGCGDGGKASLFISELARNVNIRYCPIDISAYMVSKAARTIRNKKVGEVLEFRWNISDFENLNNITPLFREGGFNTHFLMLLGNTLGNFDREDMLHGIQASMSKDDVLLIGNGLSNGDTEWADEYKDPVIDKWLVQIPQQLGLKEEDVRYDVRFVDSRIEELHVLKKDKTIQHLGKSVHFKTDDIIVTAISYKYTQSDLQQILKKFFSDVKMFTDTQGTYALALCKK
jgi:uncharacterized SAM-dependent methyltransferase